MEPGILSYQTGVLNPQICAQIVGRWQVQFFSIVVTHGDAWELRKAPSEQRQDVFSCVCIQQRATHLTSPRRDGHLQSTAVCVPGSV